MSADTGNAPPDAIARSKGGTAWLAATAFIAAFVVAFACVYYQQAQTKQVARALAEKSFFTATWNAWSGPPLYTATAKVQHELEGPAIPGAVILPEFKDMVAAMRSRELVDRTFQKIAADTHAPIESLPPLLLELAIDGIHSAVSVDADEATRTISVSYTSPSPEGATSTANMLAEQFVAQPEMLYADPRMRAAARLQSALVRAREEIALRGEELQNLSGVSAVSSPALAPQRAEMEGRLEAAETAYMELIGQISGLGDVVYDEPKLVIVERATPPTQPITPPLLRALYVSLGAGVGAGLLVALAVSAGLRLAARRA